MLHGIHESDGTWRGNIPDTEARIEQLRAALDDVPIGRFTVRELEALLRALV